MVVVSPSGIELHQPSDLVRTGKINPSVENDECRPGTDQSSCLDDPRPLRHRCRSHLVSRSDLAGLEAKNCFERSPYPMGVVRLDLVVPGGFVGVALDCGWNCWSFKSGGANVSDAAVLVGRLPGRLDDDVVNAEPPCAIASRCRDPVHANEMALAGLRIVHHGFYDDELAVVL